jgi:hypothetical protein
VARTLLGPQSGRGAGHMASGVLATRRVLFFSVASPLCAWCPDYCGLTEPQHTLTLPGWWLGRSVHGSQWPMR